MRIKYIKIWSWIAVCIFLIFVGFFITKSASWRHTQNAFPRLYKEMLSNWETSIPETVATSNAYLLLQSGNYTQALALISGEESRSYYNRGVIKTIAAYEQASGGSISWLTQASTLVQSAQKDFLLAQKLQTNKQLDQYISTNIQTTAELDIVINAKTCYTISREVITNISWLTQSIDTTKQLLTSELQSLQTSSASSDCKQQRQNTISTSQTNLTNLRDILTNQEVVQQKSLKQKRNNPVICIQPQDVSIVQNIYDMQSKMIWFQQEHAQSSSIRASKNADMISQLCQAKNDSQVNQWLQSTIDKLLNGFNPKWDTVNTPGSSNGIYYTPLDANDQKLLESVDKKNKIRIRQIQRLKSDPDYQWMNYIQNLFQEFYGNTGDFQ